MIGVILKTIRNNAGLKQESVAKEIKVARNTLSQYETETIQPTFETIEKIATLCDYSIFFINNRTNEKIEYKDLLRENRN
jgi:transcriptional regulator with XRE-family HTH domain